MAYRDDIIAILPDFYWTMADVTNGGTNLGTIDGYDLTLKTGGTYAGASIAQDAAASLESTTRTAGAKVPDNDYINGSRPIYGLGGWFELDTASDAADTPSVIYFQGGGSNNISILIANGNAILCNATASANAIINFSLVGPKIVAGRPYHIYVQWIRDAEFKVWLNGELQPNAATTPDIAFYSHAGADFGQGDTLAQGTTTVAYVGVKGRWAHWIHMSREIFDSEIAMLYANGAAQTTSEVSVTELPEDTSVGIYNLDALGGSITTTIATLIKSYSGYTNLADTDFLTDDYNVTVTSPIRTKVNRYGYTTYTTDNALNRLNNNVAFFLDVDDFITQSNQTTVGAYTDLGTLDKVYDLSQLRNSQRPADGYDLFAIDGSLLDAGSLNININKNALVAQNQIQHSSTPTTAYTLPEYGLTADTTYSQDDTFTPTDETAGLTLWAVDLTIPATPTGTLIEEGGTGDGFWFGFSSDGATLRCVAGNGSSTPLSDQVIVDVNVASAGIASTSGTLYAHYDQFVGALPVLSVYYLETVGDQWTLLGQQTIGTTNDRTGGGAGAIGKVNGAVTAGALNSDAYNDTITEARIYVEQVLYPQTEIETNALTRSTVGVNWPLNEATGTISIRSLTTLAGTSQFDGFATTGTVTIEDGTVIDDLTFDGDVNLSTAQDLDGVTVTGALDFAIAGTYDITGCTIGEVTNSSGGAVILDTDVNTTITTNTGPNITINAPELSVSITNIVPGSRLQIYNVTTATEIYNAINAGTSYSASYAEGTGYTTGDVIRVRLTQTSGATAKEEYENNAIAGASGWSVLASQVDDDVYIAFAVDGSLITKFTADYTDDEVDVILASDFALTELYAWWTYNTTTSQGISDFFGGVTAIDEGNIRINNTVVDIKLDNQTTTNLAQTDNRRLFRTDETRPVKNPGTGTGGIDVEWREPVLVTAAAPADLANVVWNDTVDRPNGSKGQRLDNLPKVIARKADL